MRKTKHLFIRTSFNDVFIVSSLSTRNDTQLIRIDQNTGRVIYNGKIGEDLFASEEDAIHCLLNVRKYTLQTSKPFDALIGLVVNTYSANLLIATSVKDDLKLFGGHVVNTVTETSWIKIPLLFPYVERKDEPKEKIQDFPIDGLHYYCDTFDITHSFPSSRPVLEYHADFCWNDYLAEPFDKAGLRKWCVVLMQGIAVSRNVVLKYPSNENESEKEVDINVCLFTRKSRINPGTRYTARGLNHEGGPGNECECEFIMWKGIPDDPLADIEWMSYVWRRGTVPLWWKTTLKSSVSGPGIVIRQDNPFQGCEKYYSRLLERYGPYNYILINMLRCDPNQKEVVLSEAYQESLKYVKGLINIDLRLIKFDWHHCLKQLGPDTTAEGFWSLLKNILHTTHLNIGTVRFHKLPEDTGDIQDWQQLCPNGAIAHHILKQKQKGVIRFNCADSLDRTNIATFFMSLQLMAEMCRRFGIGINEQLVKLNEYDLKEPWIFLSFSLSQFKKMFHKSFFDILTELFVINGDIIAMLYTNSPAMHSSLMREFSASVAAAPINAIIALKRRFHNVVNDTSRQMQYELFLGRQKDRPLLGKQLETRLLTSQENVSIINSVPCLFKNLNPTALFAQDDGFCWLSSINTEKLDSIEVIVFLSQPAKITHLGLVLSHGNSDELSPFLLDAYVGLYLDTMHVAFQNRQIARCSSGTHLYYSLLPLSDRANRLKSNPPFYDFHKSSANDLKSCRVVRLVFKGAANVSTISIGKIEIYGSSAGPTTSPQIEYELYKQKRANHLVDEIIDIINPSTNNAPGTPTTHSDTDTEEYVTISIQNISPYESGDFFSSEFTSPPTPERGEDSPPLPSPRFPKRKLSQSIQSRNPIASPKKVILDAASLIEDYAGNIVKSRDSNTDSDSHPKIVVVQEPDEPTEAPQTSFANQLSGNPQEQYKQLVLLKKRTRRDKSYEIEGVYTERPIFTLLDQLELEHFRLSNNITAIERDMILQDVGIPVLLCDPSHTIYPRSQRAETMRRKLVKDAQHCSKCRQTIKLFQNSLQCHYCRENFCKTCIHSQPSKIPEYCWDRPSTVCTSCFEIIREQKAYISAIQDLNSNMKINKLARRHARLLDNVKKASNNSSSNHFKVTQLTVPLSDYPNAGILFSIPTDDKSTPIETILIPPRMCDADTFWFAPQGITEIDLIIILSSEALVSQLLIVTDSIGYSKYDSISFKIYAGEYHDKLKYVDDWHLPSKVNSGETLIKKLSRPEHCRIMKFSMKLPYLRHEEMEQQNPFFHLKSLRIFGHPISSSTVPKLTSGEQQTYQNIIRQSPSILPTPAKHLISQWGKTKQKLELKVPNGTKVLGFIIGIRHLEDDGVASQPKVLKVSGISSYGVKKVDFQTIHELQTFILPKVQNKTVLTFPFVADVSAYHTFSFDFVSSYGGPKQPMAQCKVNLYR